ncbi:hypothetical protein SKAU_G00291470 [Synaphobranchus kaupii]|uniref:Uncharacterized protein n=1 Tax=Synaphobranchus kaupii TaxID=118154 RepID=A0A9Q1IM50_SYNKA|nr:hypothetical protein SKAU_G00291470 [Synaphobranchus kaupii]
MWKVLDACVGSRPAWEKWAEDLSIKGFLLCKHIHHSRHAAASGFAVPPSAFPAGRADGTTFRSAICSDA